MTVEPDEAENLDVGEEVDEYPTDQQSRRTRWRGRISPPLSQAGWAAVAGVTVVALLAGLTGWLGYRAYERHQADARRDLFIQVARQGAVNLTSISYKEIDADVQRIIDLSTGAFREDFEQRSKPFIEVVKAAQSKSEGTVTDAGLESQRGDSAQVLVAVAVKSQTAGGEEAPREWRMRIEVRSVGDDARVSNVVFVP
ncbi:Mce protein [Mycobacterium sp.]|uniref:Mce protein n=1 Tax=Mycobacterium sp. TaxID=1785 RepID=UPI0025E53933|nr:Mce protein [Mycobacterium sp.]